MPVIVRQSQSLCKRYNILSHPVDVYALVDTGATNTCINKRLVDRLNLEIIGDGIMDTANGLCESNLYYIDPNMHGTAYVVVHLSPLGFP
jgi:predicted aspartyl protease